MRKIKITALLLAVLMVVTAFAGCANKSTVDNLDNKVNDLDGKIQEQADALAGIQDSLKDISAAIGNQGSDELDDIKKDVEENKQNVSDILAAIESLKDQLAGATGESEDVKAAISKAGATIDALKGEYEDNKDHYTAESMAAIREILGDAQASISTKVTIEAVNDVLADMEKKLAAYKAVNEAIYEAVVALKGNITDDSAAKVEELEEALAEAVVFYDDNTAALTKYEVGDKKVNLIDEVNKLGDAQGELVELKAWAKKLVKAIDEASAEFDYDKLDALLDEYKDFVKAAKKLSEKNVALVTNYDKLTAAFGAAENVQDALLAFDKSAWEFDSLLIEDEEGIIFFDYMVLASAGVSGLYAIPMEDEILYIADVYEAIDANLADFKAEFELTDAALEYVIAELFDEYFLERYEADKALAAAFAAEYEKLSTGVFASIKAMNSKKVSTANALELVTEYKKNATDILAWNDALVAAYKAEYAKVEDALEARTYTVDDYAELVEKNFIVMVYEAKLGVYHKAVGDDPAYYEPYTDGFDTEVAGNAYFHKLYDFDRAKNTKTEDFLTIVFPTADAQATAINNKINALKPNQAESIEALVVGIGGYVQRAGDELVAIDEDYIAAKVQGNYVPKTIAEFAAKYTTANYDLSGLVDVAAYDAKLATIEKNVENAEKALADLMAAYTDLLAGKDDVIVTMDNVNKVIALEALLQKWLQLGRTDMEKATVVNTTSAGVKEYELAYILAPYAGADRDTFYAEVLNPTDFSKTRLNATETVDTGAIVRLVYKAKNLKNEAAMVVSAYDMVSKLNATGAFAFANLQNGAAAVNKVYAGTAETLSDYGVISNKATGSGTSFVNKATVVSYKGGKFVEKEITGNGTTAAAALADLKTKLAAAAFGAPIAGANDVEKNINLNNYLFGDDADTLKDLIANTDYDNLAAFTDKAIPAYVLPMIAMYLEAKFEINNMGNEYAEIEKAKNGWGAEDSTYGYDYIHGMTVARLRYNDTVSFNTLELAAVKAATNYEELRVAVNAAIEHSTWNDDILFGDSDASWLADVYNVELRKYYDANTEATALDYYDDFRIDLSEIEAVVIEIYRAEGVCQHQAPAGTECCTSYTCELCNTFVEVDHVWDANSIDVINVLVAVPNNGTIDQAKLQIACSETCCANAEAETVYVYETGAVFTFNDANTNATIDDGETVEFQFDLNGVLYNIVATFTNGAWEEVVIAA
ncbi:MAG: hypothetical protein J6B12_01270 [Clostridia bacterium]|nr:hypothetical protein [Clostridia bacterium]